MFWWAWSPFEIAQTKRYSSIRYAEFSFLTSLLPSFPIFLQTLGPSMFFHVLPSSKQRFGNQARYVIVISADSSSIEEGIQTANVQASVGCAITSPTGSTAGTAAEQCSIHTVGTNTTATPKILTTPCHERSSYNAHHICSKGKFQVSIHVTHFHRKEFLILTLQWCNGAVVKLNSRQ